jgi:hypothetical protein
LSEAYEFLCDFDCYSAYQNNLSIVLDTLDFALTQLDSVRENYKFLSDKYCVLLGQHTPKKPMIWKDMDYFSLSPKNDIYECPCCGNRNIDYLEHHCVCGQDLDWKDINI